MSAQYIIELVEKITGPAKRAQSAVEQLDAKIKKLSGAGAGGPGFEQLTGKFDKALTKSAASMSMVENQGASTFAKLVQGIGKAFGPKASEGALNLAKSIAGASDALEKNKEAVDMVKGGLGTVASVGGAAFAASAVAALALGAAVAGITIKLGIMGATYALEMGKFKSDTLFALKAITGSGDMAKATFAEMDKLARLTGSSTVEVGGSLKQLLQGGFKRGDAMSITAALQDLKAFNPEAQVGQISEVLSKMQKQGKVTGEVLEQVKVPGLQEALQKITGSKDLKELNASLASGKVTSEQGVTAVLQAISEMGKKSGTSGALGELAQQKNTNTVTGAFTQIQNSAERLFMALDQDGVGQNLISLATRLAGFLDPASESGAGLLSMLDGIAGVAEQALDAFSGQDLEGGLGELMGFLSEVGATITGVVIPGVKQFGQAFVETFSVAIVPLQTFSAAFGGSSTSAEQAIMALKGLGAVLGGVLAAIVYVGAAAVNMGIQIYDGASSALAIVGVVVSVIEGVVALFSAAGEWLYNAGGDIITGLINGILDSAGGAISAIAGVGSQLVTTIKGVLGIASPSKVMAELGGYTVDGFTKGITEGAPDVQGAMADAVAPPEVTTSAAKMAAIGGMVASGGAGGGTGNAITIAIDARGASDEAGVKRAAYDGVTAALEALGQQIGAIRLED